MGRYSKHRLFIGDVCSEWTVIEAPTCGATSNDYVKCRCSCDEERFVRVYHLAVKRSQSCGHTSRQDVAGASGMQRDQKSTLKRAQRVVEVFREDPSRVTPVILVGEDGLLSAEANFFFRQILGLPEREYLTLYNASLCVGDWWRKQAYHRARELLTSDARVLVLLGRKVAEVFRHVAFGGTPLALFESRVAPTGKMLISLPHPSRKNSTLWNGQVYGPVRKTLQELAPDLPWGSEDTAAKVFQTYWPRKRREEPPRDERFHNPLWESAVAWQFPNPPLKAGSQFGFWTVLEAPSHPVSRTKWKWKCKCVCGTVREVKGENLLNRLSQSCKCPKSSRIEAATKRADRAWKEKRIASGICPKCGNTSLPEGRRCCLDCNAKMAARKKERREERVANNQCPCCGDAPAPGRKHCQQCLYRETARMFKLPVEEVIALRSLPCEVCGETGNSVLDHNHATGAVRGPLCNSCNSALGFARENPELLQRLIEYLQRYSSVNGMEITSTSSPCEALSPIGDRQ